MLSGGRTGEGEMSEGCEVICSDNAASCCTTASLPFSCEK